jgi:hypothetical protein
MGAKSKVEIGLLYWLEESIPGFLEYVKKPEDENLESDAH